MDHHGTHRAFASFGLLLLAGAAAASTLLPMRGDPGFHPEDLAPAQRLWYDRLLLSIEASRDLVDERASSRDLYYTGRTVGDYNAALLMAFRATGDLSLLDRVAETSELYRAQLADPWLDGTTDGYRNWLWLIDPDNPTYYGNDLHQADEVIMHGNVGLVAWAFEQNRDLDPAYAEKADFWLDYLENDFLAKWYERSGTDSVTAWEATESEPGNALYRRFAVTRSNQMRLGYYLWKITGDSFYLDRANACADDLVPHMQLNPLVPTAYRWKHQIAGTDEGWQRINYAQYFLRVVQEMHYEGFREYENPIEMQRFTSTFVDVVLPAFGPPYSLMAYRVDGSESTGFNMYNTSGFARWDSTGFLLERAEEAYTDGLNGVSIAAYALLALTEPVPSAAGPPAPADRGSVLSSCGPNPTRGALSWTFGLQYPAPIRLDLFDASGARVLTLCDRNLGAGTHRFAADLDREAQLPAATYFLRLQAGRVVETRKITVTR